MYQKTLILFICVTVLTIVVSLPVNETQNAAVICNLPEEKGRCRALLVRWRYDAATKKCGEFNFGGCEGNRNNFSSEKACMNLCTGLGTGVY